MLIKDFNIAQNEQSNITKNESLTPQNIYCNQTMKNVREQEQRL